MGIHKGGGASKKWQKNIKKAFSTSRSPVLTHLPGSYGSPVRTHLLLFRLEAVKDHILGNRCCVIINNDFVIVEVARGSRLPPH
jgi:hypothetical protein